MSPLSPLRPIDAGLVEATGATVATTSSTTVAQVRVVTASLLTDSVEEAAADLGLLTAAADLVGLSGLDARESWLADWSADVPGWSVHQPLGASGLAVAWRERCFAAVDAGACAEVDGEGPRGASARPLPWVTLRHCGTGVVITWIESYLAPEPGGEDAAPDAPADESLIAANLHSMRLLLELVDARATVGEVLVGGQWSRCAREDRQARDPRFPFTVLEAQDRPESLPGLRSTYSFHGFPELATSRRRHLGHIAMLRHADPRRRTLAFTGHQVLAGYRSAHRPLRAEVAIAPRGRG